MCAEAVKNQRARVVIDGYTAEGLPVGMSVIGRRFDEQTILQCADAFEQTFAPTAPAKL